jgi:hypothetical protein
MRHCLFGALLRDEDCVSRTLRLRLHAASSSISVACMAPAATAKRSRPRRGSALPDSAASRSTLFPFSTESRFRSRHPETESRLREGALRLRGHSAERDQDDGGGVEVAT